MVAKTADVYKRGELSQPAIERQGSADQSASNFQRTVVTLATVATIAVAMLVDRGRTSDGHARVINDHLLRELRRTATTDGNLRLEPYLLQPEKSDLVRSIRLQISSQYDGIREYEGSQVSRFLSDQRTGSNAVLSLEHPSLMNYQSLLPHQEAVRWIQGATQLRKDRIAYLLGVSRQTLRSWELGKPIADDHRQRLLLVQELLKRATRKYSTSPMLLGWLDTPRGDEGKTPAELIRSGDYDRARYFAVSSANPNPRPSPPWVRKGVPSAFQSSAEQPQVAFPPEDAEDDLTSGQIINIED